MELSDIIKSFETNSRGKQRFKDFLTHCYYTFDKKIKCTKSKRMINKYNIIRKNTLEYIVANEKAIMSDISKRN
tara:strand:- start:966 stop:1187 length:222 start_codon:yes stop_codon:yes gene_type:complete